jgi:hypothetical protein
MAKLSIELLRKEHNDWIKLEIIESFGAYMNSKYNLGNEELNNELDSNVALLMIMSNYVINL